jgi:hypothetical protein
MLLYSGPATLALTQVLTGGVSTRFVAYADRFKPKSEAESAVQRISDDLVLFGLGGIAGPGW